MFKSFLRKRKKETSVLNTDSFDKRRFNQIYGMSKGLQQLDQIEELPLFRELLGDIWASLYKMNPILKDEIGPHLEPNMEIMDRLMNDESYLEYRDKTRLDDMLSAIGTLNFGKKTHEWIEKQREENEELNKQMEEMQKLINQMQSQSKSGVDNSGKGQQMEQQLNQAMTGIKNSLSQSLESNGHTFSQAISQAVSDTKQAKEGLESLFGGFQKGNGHNNELQKMPLRHKIELAEKLSHDKKLKDIAKWAGRYTKIARTKQKMKHKESTEQSGIEQGNNIERVLPSELVQYINPVTKNDFLKRYAEGQLMQYEQKGKQSLGQGSIVLCLDQSGSMRRLETKSKGFALALMAIAKKQRRNFAYIPFDSRVGNVMQFSKGRIKPNEMLKIAREFMDGGTDFKDPLQESLKIIKKDKFKDADIVFVTDGQDVLSDEFINTFNETKEKEKFNVLSLVIGNSSDVETTSKFSERVIQITDFDDEGAFEAFEI